MDREASLLTYLGSIVTIAFFGFYSLIILPIFVQSSKTVVHRCSNCGEVLDQKELFSLPSLSDPVNLIFKKNSFFFRKNCFFDCFISYTIYFFFQYINLPFKQVFQFRFGSCALIISRKYSIIVLTLISIIFFYRYITAPPVVVPTETKRNYKINNKHKK